MRFVLALIVGMMTAASAWAATDCSDTSALVRRFYDDAGLNRLSEQTWFRDCVHRDLREDRIWATLEDYAIAARNSGLEITSVTPNYDVVRVDFSGVTMAFLLTRGRNRQVIGVDGLQTSVIGLQFSDLLGRFKQLPGKTSLVVTRNGRDLISHNADLPLQVSSSMKLGVLKVLLDDSAAGRLKLTDTAVLKPEFKNLPSGTLQQFPNGSVLTLHTLAALMMRDSDNTASDVLIDRLGADRIAAVLELPFIMNFHQWFMMKGDRKLYDDYRSRDPIARAKLLKELTPQVPLYYSDTFVQPTPEAGWHVSTRKLCNLASGVAASEFSQLANTFVQFSEWRSIASKAGGDETSRNDTIVATRIDGEQFCMSVTWNTDAPIDNDQRYLFLLTSLMEAIRRYDVKLGKAALIPY